MVLRHTWYINIKWVLYNISIKRGTIYDISIKRVLYDINIKRVFYDISIKRVLYYKVKKRKP